MRGRNSNRGTSEPRRGMIAPLAAVCMIPLIGTPALSIDGGMLMSEQLPCASGGGRGRPGRRRVRLQGPQRRWLGQLHQGSVGRPGDRHGQRLFVRHPVQPAADLGDVCQPGRIYRGGHRLSPARLLRRHLRGRDGRGPGARRGAGDLQPLLEGRHPRPRCLGHDGHALGHDEGGRLGGERRGRLDVRVVDHLLRRAPSITTPELDLSGNISYSGTNPNKATTTNFSQAPTPDPLANLATPTTTGLTVQSNSAVSLSGSTTRTLNPGVYKGGITLSGSSSVTLNPGVYYINGGGITLSGPSGISGSGVFIYNTGGGAISLSGTGAISLSPMTSGTYAGLTIFQDRSSAVGATLSGGSNINLTGTYYFPSAPLTMSGSSSVAASGRR